MAKENKKPDKTLEETKSPDYSEGFGGLSDETSLTANLGCVPDRSKSNKKPVWKQAE